MFEDNDQMELSRYKWIIPFVVIILIISMLLVRCSTDNLKGYVDESSLSDSANDSKNTESEKVTEIEEEKYTYEDTDLNFTISIPVSWSKVNSTDHDVIFINKQTGTSLKIQVIDYDPQINNIDEDDLVQQASSNGMKVIDYAKPNNSSYYVSYNSNETGFIEYTYWDYEKVIRLNFSMDISYYNDTKTNNTIKYINNSFNWAKNSPLPDGLTIAYVSYGNFEFGYPEGWNYGESSNSIMTTNEEGSAAYSITINETTTTLDGISQVDYINYLSQTKPNFMLSSFSNDGTVLSCVGTYIQNGVKINLQQYVIVNGQYEYILSIDTESQVTSDLSVTIQRLVNSFKCY